MKKLVFIVLLFSLPVIAALNFFRFDLFPFLKGTTQETRIEKLVNIKPGQGLSAVSARLHEAGIIENRLAFSIIARIKGYDKKIRAGEYMLSSDMDSVTILETLVRGKMFLHKLVIPEGYNLSQIAQTIGDAGFALPCDFVKLAKNPTIIKQHGITAKTLEGYLFPDTYHFPKGVSCEKIISAFIERFKKIFTLEMKERAEELGFSVHQVLTLASIIEKETGAAKERPLIASVFHNRLKRRMRLESDPTVIYGVKNFDGNLTKKHLMTTTPYNTYRIKGLPPGPIASPGKDAIMATLFPADTKYFFFVSKKDSTHKFSRTFKEHKRAVRKYQLGK